MIRTKDATFLNAVANHPDVRPWLGLDGRSRIDLAGLIEDDANIALVNEFGGFVFVHKGDGEFEVHTQFLPEGRGQPVRDAAAEARRAMFEDFGASILSTYVPHGNRAAFGLVRLLGFSCVRSDGEATYWALDRAGWEARRARLGDKMGLSV